MPEFCFLSQNKAYLSQDHTTCHIHKYMLLGKNGRQKNQHSQCKRYPLIPYRNSFLILDPQKTEPAYQTMDRWKQVICRINGIQPAGQQIPDSVSFDHRSCIGSGICQKYDQTHTTGYNIRSKKTVNLFPLLPCRKDIIHCPEYITTKIDNQKLRHKWEPQIKITFYIVMISTACDRP